MAPALKAGDRVRLYLLLRKPVIGTVQQLCEDGKALVQWDDEPHVRREISQQVLFKVEE